MHLQLILFSTEALDNRQSTFYLYRFAFLNIHCKNSHIICGLCVWPFPFSIWICNSSSSKVSVLFRCYTFPWLVCSSWLTKQTPVIPFIPCDFPCFWFLVASKHWLDSIIYPLTLTFRWMRTIREENHKYVQMDVGTMSDSNFSWAFMTAWGPWLVFVYLSPQAT